MLICASSAPLASEGKYNVTKIRGELGHSASSPAVNAISGPLDSYVEDQTQRSLAMDIKSSSAAGNTFLALPLLYCPRSIPLFTLLFVHVTLAEANVE
jgi:hypothetical protein